MASDVTASLAYVCSFEQRTRVMKGTNDLYHWLMEASGRRHNVVGVALSVALVLGNLVPIVPAQAVDSPSDVESIESAIDTETAGIEAAIAEVPALDEAVAGDLAAVSERSPVDEKASAGESASTEAGSESTTPVAVEGELTATSEHYRVTVAYSADAGIPRDARLSVREFGQTSAEYREAYEAVIGIDYDADIAGDGIEYGELDESGEVPYHEVTVRPVVDQATLGLEAMDITILDDSGAVIEPSAAVRVSVVRTTLPNDVDEQTFAQTASIVHHDESTGAVSIETVAAAGDNTPGELVVEGGELRADFTTESFSTFTVTWGYGNHATIHYVDEQGNELAVANGDPSAANLTTTPAYLIYDVDGYEYSYTYRNSSGNRIVPELRYGGYGAASWQYATTAGQWWSSLSNNDDIYVVYTPKAEPTQGGTPKPHPSGGSETPAEPEIEKASEDNHDGTRTLSLSITGHEVPMEVEKLADVIVVFDVSGSMNNDMAGNVTYNQANRRITIAKQATNDLADELLAKTNSSGDPLIRMSLISFSNTASVVQGFTEDPTTFKSAVNGLSADGGTNWEDALQLANTMEVDPDRATFVIFVTDGNPTFRNTRGALDNAGLDVNDTYYPSYNVYGTGNSDNQGRNFSAALAEATSIVDQGKHFYTIGISNDVSNLTRLTTEAGAGADHSFTATSGEDLVAAFDEIAASIESTLGWGDATLTDGVTRLTNLTAKSPVVGVDEDTFTYFRKTADGDWEAWDPASEGVGTAFYNEDTGAVEWPMGEDFQLEDGVSYKVEFLVWPSQAAMDLVTQLNNGERDFEDLTAEEAAQVGRTGSEETGYHYYLKTNTDDAHTTYYQTTQTGDNVSVIGDEQSKPFNDVDPLVLDTMTMRLEKVWTDTLTGGEGRDNEVALGLQRRVVNQDGTTGEWEDFAAPYINPEGERVIDSTIRLSDANGWQAEFFISPGLVATGVTYNPGYEFRLVEISVGDEYEFASEVIKPMLINLVQTYVGDDDHSNSLTGENVVKGDLTVEKVVVDEDGNEVFPEESFTVTGTLLDAAGNPLVTDEPLRYDVYAQDGTLLLEDEELPATGQVTLMLAAGQHAHFKNLPTGATFSFTEKTEEMSWGYSFVSAEGQTLMKEEPGEDFIVAGTQPTADGATVSGSLVANARHSVTFTNQVQTIDLTLEKTDDAGRRIDGATFELWQDDTLLAEGIELGTYTLEDLYPGTYRLVETEAPSGYDLLTAPIWFEVGAGGVSLVEPEGETTANDHATPDAANLRLSISNTPGVLLPMSGGSGTTLITSCGAALVVASVMRVLTLRRKRERRSNA